VPLSNEEMAIIKKKVAPPKGPPPAGFANFKAPKKYDEDENHNDSGHRPPPQRRHDEGSDEDDENNSRERRHLKQRYQEEENNAGRHRPQRSEEKHQNRLRYPHENDEIEDLDCTEVDHWHPPPQNKRNPNEPSKRSSRDRDQDYDPDPDLHSPSHHINDRPLSAYEGGKQSSSSPSYRRHDFPNPGPPPGSSLGPGLSPPRLKIYNYKKILRSSFKELKSFVTSPCEPHTSIRCYIERNRSGTNYLTPVYSLCADLEDGTGRELISCRKFLKSKTSYYIFSLKAEDLYRKREQRGRYYLGKLRAVSGDDYVLYDNGVCDTMRSHGGGTSTDLGDEDLDEEEEGGGGVGLGGRGQSSSSSQAQRGSYDAGPGGGEESSLYRSQLAIVHYNTKLRPVDEGVRGMEVCLPRLQSQQQTAALDASHGDMAASFDRIMKAGRQNELFGNKYVILHEKRSR
jgi:hypothetical protein